MQFSRLQTLIVAAIFMVLSAAEELIHGRHDHKQAARTLGPVTEMSPEPTEAPLMPRELQKRTNTCGYINGHPDFFVTCVYPGAECRYDSTASAIGCCLPNSCNIVTTCLPSRSSFQGATADLAFTQYCSESTAPFCAVYSYMDPDYHGYTMHFCNSVRTTHRFYAQTFGAGGLTSTTSEEADPTSSTSTGPESTDPTSTSTTPEEPGPTTTEPAPPSPGGGTSVGPIVGGVVGGVAGIAALSFLAWFLLIRRRKAREQQPEAQPPPMQQQQPYPPPGAPGPHPPVMMTYSQAPPMYDNRMSTMKPSPDGYAAAYPTSPGSPGSAVSPPGSAPMSYEQAYLVSAPSNPAGSHPAAGQSGQRTQRATELPQTRGDGELRELQ